MADLYHRHMSLLKKPGASLLVVGLVLLVIVQPLSSMLPVVGRVISPIAFVVGLFGIVGGGYLLSRSVFGKN